MPNVDPKNVKLNVLIVTSPNSPFQVIGKSKIKTHGNLPVLFKFW